MRGLLLGYDCMVFADTLESVDEVSVRVFLLSMPVTQGLKMQMDEMDDCQISATSYFC